MFNDALWTSIYTDEEIRLIEEREHLDMETQNSINELVELAISLSAE
jgi:hypothetical protein